MSSPVEVKFTLSEGLVLAGQKYMDESQPQQILLLHGWMDNCRSFDQLAPYLPGTRVALDFAGHGQSQHASVSVLAEAVYHVAEVLKILNWKNDETILIGHSMGAAVASLYTAAFGVQQLILLDGAAPLARPAADVAKHIRAHVRARQKGVPSTRKEYASVAQATAVRQKTATLLPGNQYLSEASARAMVERGTTPNPNGSVSFCHDPRLTWPSIVYMTPEQTHVILQEISCPTLFLRAKDGWPIDTETMDKLLEALQPTQTMELHGSHHFHADPDTAPAVRNAILEFLQQEPRAKH